MLKKTTSLEAASVTNFQYKCQNSSTVWGGNLENYESHHPEDTSVYSQLSTQNTSDPLAKHYQQQPTMAEIGLENTGQWLMLHWDLSSSSSSSSLSSSS
ncbi:unnamed protein product [Schistosoma margrebowiei]|uniref:Uncharacterized protein n=1 Tax=Schistosoma margrebowiei TaxID=48269 RepID=A0A183LQC6_9TREM|nr:unnamed protein product [Schistosoma margrebowiei]